MTDVKQKILDFFSKGFDLREINSILFPYKTQNESEMIILSLLGLKTRREYITISRKQQYDRAKSEASTWLDAGKSEEIKKLFEQDVRLDEIRRNIFPEIYEITSKSEFYFKREIASQIIYRVLECKDGEGYKRIRRNLKGRLKSKKLRESGYFTGRKAALERDGYKCVVTGSEESLQVHHIDGNHTNNDLHNLITVTKEVQLAIHNGARGLNEERAKYWESKMPEYAKKVQERLRILKLYADKLQSRGYPNARLECIPASELFKNNEFREKLSFNIRSKKRSGCYWLVVLEPTGYHVSPEEQAAKETEYWTDRKKKYDYSLIDDEDDFGGIFSRDVVGPIGEPTGCPKCKTKNLLTYQVSTRNSDEKWELQECTGCGYSSDYEE